ncbi:MAG TPA: cytochrome c oxidase subunit II [Candidatus Dormibacteraeota bacterium]
MSYRSSPVLRRLLLAAPLVMIALLPGTALAASGLNPLPPAGVSPNGRNIYNLYLGISIPALIVFALVEGLLLTIVIRDRRRRLGPDYKPPQWHGNGRLEIIWTVVPLLLMVAIGTVSFFELQRDFQRPADAATDMQVDVSGHQFGWTFAYPQGFAITSDGLNANPLVVPTGKLVRLKLNSEDVIHGFWVPDISGKTDLVPGYDNYTWFKIDQPGEWRGECTELCGSGHSTMQLLVKAVSPSDFNTWAAQQQAAQAPSPSPPAGSPGPSPRASASPSPSPSASVRPSPSPSS